MKIVQHAFSVMAAILLIVGSLVQARKAVDKAEHELSSLPDENSLKKSLRRKLTLGLVLEAEARLLAPELLPWRKAEDKADQLSGATMELMRKRPGDTEFSAKHFLHVALLWAVIMVGSVFAVLAECMDLLITLGML